MVTEMREKLEEIRARASAQLSEINADLEAIRIKYLGKKGELTAVLRNMGSLSPEERPAIGAIANEVRTYIENALAERLEAKKKDALGEKLEAERLDVTMPGTAVDVGRRHPLAKVRKEMEDIFIGMGFSVVEGPEVEYDYYNFQALNIPENHNMYEILSVFRFIDYFDKYGFATSKYRQFVKYYENMC